MKVKFVRDFRSKSTGERFYGAGMVGEFSDTDAAVLIAEGAAVKAGAGDKVTGPDPWADFSGGELRGIAEKAVRERNLRNKVWR